MYFFVNFDYWKCRFFGKIFYRNLNFDHLSFFLPNYDFDEITILAKITIWSKLRLFTKITNFTKLLFWPNYDFDLIITLTKISTLTSVFILTKISIFWIASILAIFYFFKWKRNHTIMSHSPLNHDREKPFSNIRYVRKWTIFVLRWKKTNFNLPQKLIFRRFRYFFFKIIIIRVFDIFFLFWTKCQARCKFNKKRYRECSWLLIVDDSRVPWSNTTPAQKWNLSILEYFWVNRKKSVKIVLSKFW